MSFAKDGKLCYAVACWCTTNYQRKFLALSKDKLIGVLKNMTESQEAEVTVNTGNQKKERKKALRPSQRNWLI